MALGFSSAELGDGRRIQLEQDWVSDTAVGTLAGLDERNGRARSGGEQRVG